MEYQSNVIDSASHKKVKVADENGGDVNVIYREADSNGIQDVPASSGNAEARSGSNAVDSTTNGSSDLNEAEASNPFDDSAALQSVLDQYEPQLLDEGTCRQMENIEREIKQAPLVGPMEDLNALEQEYVTDEIYYLKVLELKTKYSVLRRTRGDGNCFYRSFGFKLFENLMKSGDSAKIEEFQKFTTDCCNDLVGLGYNKFTLEDFADQFNDQLSRLVKNPTEDEVLQIFLEEGISNYIVAWLRHLTSLQLQKEEEFYQNFIENHPTIKDFCQAEVEPMFRESDHIHIIALTSLTKIKVRVEYLDRGDAANGISHDFPENEDPPQICLLYRPGHYDILYPQTP